MAFSYFWKNKWLVQFKNTEGMYFNVLQFKILHVATDKQIPSVPEWKWMQPEANCIIFKIAI
jgi:hypothetical protein